MTFTIIKNLCNALNTDGIAIFAGSGISIDPPSNLPSWSELAHSLLRELLKQEPKGKFDQLFDSLIKLDIPPEVIVERIAYHHDYECKELIADILTGTSPNRHHFRLADLAKSVRIFVTTNYDNCLEQAFSERDINYVILQTDADFIDSADTILHGSSTPIIAKLHGDVLKPESMLTTLSEGRRGLSGAKRRFMNTLLEKKHLLFIGYSGGDLYIDDNRLLMRQAAPYALGFTWVFHPGSYKPPMVQNLIDLYNSRHANKACMIETGLDKLLPELCISARVKTGRNDVKPAQEKQKAIIHWPRKGRRPLTPLVFGELFLHVGNFKLAEQVFKETIDSISGPEAENIRTAAITALARLNQQQGNHKGALEILNHYRDQWDENAADTKGLKTLKAFIHVINAESLSKIGQIGSAVEALEKSCTIFSDQGDYKNLLKALGNYGNTLRDLGKIDEAKRALQNSLNLAVQVGDVASEATAYNNLGLVHLHCGEYKEGLEAFKKTIHIATAISDIKGLCSGQFNYGLILNSLGQLDEAYSYFEKVKELSEEHDMFENLGKAENAMGMIEYYRQNHSKAIEHWKKAGAIFTKCNCFLGNMEVLNNIAELFRISGDLGLALDNINRALELMLARGFDLRTAPYFHTRGLIFIDLAKYEQAVEDFERALKIYHDIGNLHARAKEIYHLGVCFTLTQAFIEAEEKFMEAETIQRQFKDFMALADTLKFRGKVSLCLGKQDAAVECFKEAAEVYERLGLSKRAEKTLQEIRSYLGNVV